MRTLKCALAASILTLGLASTATATTVTVGSPLTTTFTASEVLNPGTIMNASIGLPGANTVSPVTGAIVRWHLTDAQGGPFRLRVLRPAGGSSFTALGSSASVSGTATGLDTFTTALPIQAGDAIGLDITKGAKVGAASAPTSGVAVWAPQLAEGATLPYAAAESGAEFGFNAEVQPQPTVTALSPGSGSFKGRTRVTVTGTDFAAVSAVKFGSRNALSFTVGSEGQLTAVAPPGAPGATNLTVTTVAGTSPVASAKRFTYTACVVPKLQARKLKAAKAKLKKAGCKIGKVRREDGVTARSGKVVAQGAEAG